LCANLADPKTVNFLKLVDCIDKTNKKALMATVEKELIGSIQSLASNKTMKWDEKFHGACCSAFVFRNKALKYIEPECGKFKDAQESMINSMVGDLLEAACPEPSKMDEICPKLPKLVLAKEWKPASLTGAALDLIIVLSETPKQ